MLFNKVCYLFIRGGEIQVSTRLDSFRLQRQNEQNINRDNME